MRCAEPGCGGTVVDGYCDVCGTAPAPDAPAHRNPSRPRRRRAPLPLRRREQRRCERLAPVVDDGKRSRPPRRRDRRDAAHTEGRPCRRDPERPPGTGGEPVLRQSRMQQAGRTQPGRTTRAHGGLLPRVRHAIFVCSQAFSRRPCGWAVRSPGMHRARRPRLDLSGDRPQREQPLGGAQGPAELRRRRGHGRGRRRGPRPRRGRTPEHRRHLQLRPTSGLGRGPRRLHRHGVRRRNVAEADPQGAQRPASAGSGRRLHRRDRSGPWLPALARTRLLRLQAGQRDAGR